MGPSARNMSTPRPVLVVDFGAQYAQLIARRVREAQVYSEVVPHTDAGRRDAGQGSRRRSSCPAGRPACTSRGAPQVDPALFDAGVPVFGICYGFQAMARRWAARSPTPAPREYGAHRAEGRAAGGTLLRGLPEQQSVWMSHGDASPRPRTGSTRHRAVGRRAGGGVRGPAAGGWPGCSTTRRWRTPSTASRCCARFLHEVAGIAPTWTPANIIDEQVAAIRAQVGDGRVICGLSGGVDSAVAAALVHRAVGDQLTCVFVDHGLLRAGEAEQVEKDYVAATGIRLGRRRRRAVPGRAGRRHRPGAKRKIIGREFIRVFEAAAREIGRRAARVEFLVQGTLYPDVVESGGGTGTANIKSPPQRRRPARRPAVQAGRAAAHAVQGRGARGSARELGLPEEIVWRHPFPGPGPGDPDHRRGRPRAAGRCCAPPTRSPARS